MKPLFKCELKYFHSPHLSQIYEGFEKLRKAGIVEISVTPCAGDTSKPLLTVIVDNKYTAIYDTLDGLNWISGSIEDNLEHFKNNVNADFYFKRSYNAQVAKYAPPDCSVYPLGLNFAFKPEGKYERTLKETFKDWLKDSHFLSGYYEKASFDSREFEYFPAPCKVDKVLFMARLWDPAEVSLEHLKAERELINRSRIECIRACQREFGKQFTGGLQNGNFAARRAKDLIMPFALTKRETFLDAVKEHNVCIATTGLHGSIGWKFGEYVAAARAIVSEPLQYELPGNFDDNTNYLAYDNENDLLTGVRTLLNDKNKMFEMMKSNFHYYNNYVKSDKLVLNSLLKIHQTAYN